MESKSAIIELVRLISLRHLLFARLRSVLVLFGIALGVATLVATIAVNRSILSSFHEMVERVAGKADLILTSGEVGVSADLVEVIRGVEDIAHVAGSLEITTRLPSGGGPLLLLGLDFLGDPYFLPLAIEKGGEDVLEDPFAVVNDPSAVFVSKSLARAAGTRVGGEIELLTPDGPRAFHVRGILEETGLASAFGGHVAVMFTEAAGLAFGREGRVDRIDIAIVDGASVERAMERIQAAVEHRGRVERPGGRTSHLEAITQPIRRALYIAGVMALLVGMFLIYNAVGVAVAQRQREIGVLRALGVTKRRVVALFCIEALILALVGGCIGLPLGYVLSKLALAQTLPTVSRFYAPIRPPPPAIGVGLALVGLAIGALATLAAAYWPARLAAKVDPIEPLRRATRKLSIARIPHVRMLALAGALFVPIVVLARIETTFTSFASMFLVLASGLLATPSLVKGLRRTLLPSTERLLGVPGRLGLDNAERSLGRSALAVGALMTSVSSAVCVGSWAASLQGSMLEWLDQSLPADLYVTSGSFIADQHNVPFRRDAVDLVKGVPGIEAAYPARVVGLDVSDKRVQMIALDIQMYFEQIEKKNMGGRPPIDGPGKIDPDALLREPAIVIGENAARKLSTRAGADLVLETAKGPRTFKVYAVVVDYTSDLGSVLVDHKWYQAFWEDDLVDTIDVFLAKDASATQVSKEIRRRFAGGEALFVVSAAEVRGEIRSVIDQSLAIFHSTDFLALMVALLGVVGTMFAAVIDRIKEIGVLRAIGATRRQIASAVLVEASFLGVSAAIGGILAGIPMGYVFVRVVGLVATGWHVDYVFPLEGALRTGVGVILTAALAGLLPGRRVSRMDVPEALAYE